MLERRITEFADLSFGERSRKRHGLCTKEQLNEILKAENPCLVIIKPHAANNGTVRNAVNAFIDGFGLKILVEKRMQLTESHVFGLYGDLPQVKEEGKAGTEFVNKLVFSFVEIGEAIVYIVSGDDAYKKMKTTKRFLREMGAEDKFRNLMHSSDNIEETIREISSFFVDE